MKSDIVSSFLSERFRRLGETVATHPGYFILIPIFTTLILSTGLQRLELNSNIEYLSSPQGSRSVREKQRMHALFPPRDGANYYPGREVDLFPYGSVIITSSDGETVFRDGVLREVSLVDKLIKSIVIKDEDRQWTYKDLCVKNKGRCFENGFLTLIDKAESIVGGNYSIKYPISFSNQWRSFSYFGDSIGGVKLDGNGYILNAKAIRLFYILEGHTAWKKKLARQWQLAFLDRIDSMNFRNITIDRLTEISEERELIEFFVRVVALIPFSAAGILVFSAITCLYKDWIQSKPWTGVIASTSATFALASAFGLVSYCEVVFTVSLAPIPFLILGVGMDDTYVLLAKWKHSDPKKGVVERMGEAYQKSSVAITVTSLTNFISFAAGIATSFPSVRIFSVYASISILFAYIYQMTFVGGCMAVCGYLERQNRHSLTFARVEDSSGNRDSSSSTKCFPRIDLNLWKLLGDALSMWQVKIAAVAAMMLYVAIGFYGITKVRCIADIRDDVMYDSPIIPFIDKKYLHFGRYDLSIQIVIDGELDYADTSVQSQIEQLMTKIESTGYIADSSVTESWLRYYLHFLKGKNTASIIESYNMSNTRDFIEVLRKVFLRIPVAERFQQDIVFSPNYSSIVGSRFICRSGLIRSPEEHFEAIADLRKTARESPFKVFPYHFNNFIVDSVSVQVGLTVQTLGAVTAAIFILCLFSIANFVAVICISFTVILIEANVIGYMTLWGVTLSPIPMTIVIGCAGLAVDYAAHISHAYNISKGLSRNQRMRTAIDNVGMAIFQGCATTILSLLPLLYPIAKSCVTGFKIVFLVCVFSLLHSLVFLPMALSSLPFLKEIFRKKGTRVMLTKDEKTATTEEINMTFKKIVPSA